MIRELIVDVTEVLPSRQSTKDTLKLKNSRFFTDMIDNCEHMKQQKRPGIAFKTIFARIQFKESYSAKKLRLFFGLVKVFWEFNSKFVRVGFLIHHSCKKNNRNIIWGLSITRNRNQWGPFNFLIYLTEPCPERNYMVDTDVYNVQVKCFFLREKFDCIRKSVVLVVTIDRIKECLWYYPDRTIGDIMRNTYVEFLFQKM